VAGVAVIVRAAASELLAVIAGVEGAHRTGPAVHRERKLLSGTVPGKRYFRTKTWLAEAWPRIVHDPTEPSKIAEETLLPMKQHPEHCLAATVGYPIVAEGAVGGSL
jgi:hypothetical protein